MPAEIELIAAGPVTGATPPSETVSYLTPPETTASPVFSRVAYVHGGKQIYLSGLYADEPGSTQAQGRGLFDALRRMTKETGSDMRHLVKATYYVTNDADAEILAKLRYESYDPLRPPAASKAVVRGVGMSNRTMSLDMIAVTPQ